MKWIELWPGFAVRKDLVNTVQFLGKEDSTHFRDRPHEARVIVSYGSPRDGLDGRTVAAQVRLLEPATMEDYKRILEVLNEQ